MNPHEIVISNNVSVLTADYLGGAITGFVLNDAPVNPLSFRFDRNEMPANNQTGAPYQGHFVCLGRWGKPTAGETRTHVPDHGQFANMEWTDAGSDMQKRMIRMEAGSAMEGLYLHRTLSLDHSRPVICVEETVTNPGPLARFYQMVQHPTLATPFVGNDVVICSNAGAGFDQVHAATPERFALNWPKGIDENRSSVFSYVVEPKAPFGWITAYSPQHQLLFGYVWPRDMYPWIIVWQHREQDQLIHLGLEFGTTGLPHPMHQLVEDGNTVVFNEKTYAFLDAGDSVDRRYYAFLHRPQLDATRITDISLTRGNLLIRSGRDTEEMPLT